MEGILEKLNLGSCIPKFAEENITPDIVCRLSAYDLEVLGLHGRADMVRLRAQCIKFGGEQLPKVMHQSTPAATIPSPGKPQGIGKFSFFCANARGLIKKERAMSHPWGKKGQNKCPNPGPTNRIDFIQFI